MRSGRRHSLPAARRRWNGQGLTTVFEQALFEDMGVSAVPGQLFFDVIR